MGFCPQLSFRLRGCRASPPKIERMCDRVLPTVEALRCADDAAVVAAITDCAQLEAVASSRRLAAIAELVGRRARHACESSGLLAVAFLVDLPVERVGFA